MADAGVPVILALEASADSAEAVLLAGDRILAETAHEARHGHAARMLVLVRDCLAEAGVAIDGVEALVAGRGPGSFTGIRVALAAAKGLALSRGIAGYGLPSLEAVAYAASTEAGGGGSRKPVAVLADTRRGSVFTGLFEAGGSPVGETLDLPPADVAGHLVRHGREWIVAGTDGAAEAEFDWAGAFKAAGVDAHLLRLRASARHVGRLFLARHRAGDTGNCPLEPLYLSEPLLGPAGSKAVER